MQPSRTEGNTRIYTHEDIERLDVILSLTRDLDVNLGGVEIIFQMRKKMDAMQRQMREFVRNVNDSMEWVGDDEDLLSNALIAVRTRFSVRPREREGKRHA